MSSFIALRKILDLSSDNNRHLLVGRQNRDIPDASNGKRVVTAIKRHYDFDVSVSFDSNGGTACASQTYTLGSTYKDLPTPTKIQNVFLGWLVPNGQYVLSSSNVELSNTQLTAQWEQVNITGDYTSYLAVATSSYRNTGIYAANRYSSASAVYIDWGDGAVEKINGNVSKLAHTYSANGNYTVKVSNNITNFAPSYNDSTWYQTTSHNRYTFKDITKVGSRLTSIPAYAFYYCSALSSINWLSSFSRMSQIPSYCFYYCSSIPSLSTLSSTSFRSTSTYAFSYCSGLRSLAGIEKFTSFGNNTFYYCQGLSSIDQLSATSIRSLPNYCFSYCSGLKNLNGAKLITSFGSYCFQNCTGLTGVVDMTDFAYTSLPNSYVFANCTNVKEFKLPTSFTGTYLGSYMFYYCSQLSGIDLPSTLTAIPSNCFYYCSNLRHIDIPSGVKILNGSAFRYSGLSSINLPSALTSITGNYTFANCTSLKSIDIPDAVKTIANYSFYYDSALTSIDLPSSLTSLTAYVMQGCYNLGEITIPSSVTNIGNYALAGCYRLSVINALRSTAPSIASTYAFGYSASSNQYSGYTGYSTRGSNRLNVPTGATGYSTGAWSSPLQNASYCGFTLVEGGV